MSQRQRPRLRQGVVLDSDPTFLAMLESDPAFDRETISIARDQTSARESLEDVGVRYQRIWVGSNVRWPCLIPMIQKIHHLHPGTPIYVLHDVQSPVLDTREIYRLAVQSQLPRPSSLASLIQVTGLESVIVKSLPVLPAAAANTVDPDVLSDEDRGYVAVRIEEFFSGAPNPFDVFLRMGSGKYLKVSKAKEALDTDRVLRYFQTGVEFLYVRQSSWRQCLSYCDLLSRVMISSQGVSDSLKFANLVSIGEETLRLFDTPNLLTPGVDQAARIDQLHRFLGDMNHFISRDDASRAGLVKTYLNQARNFEHSVNVSVFAVFLAQTLELRRPQILWQIGAAALLHDVGKILLPPRLQTDVDPRTLNSDERALYEQHPLKSAEVLRNLPGIEEVAIQGVEQHHERRDGAGYPRRPVAGDINLFGEIIGVSNDFVDLLMSREPRLNLPQINQNMEAQYLSRFSVKVADAFRKTFFDLSK